MTSIPRKVQSDHLLETIVEVRFESSLSSELWLGLLMPYMQKAGFKFVPTPKVTIQFGTDKELKFDVSKDDTVGGLFIKDDIRVVVQNKVVSFNCNLGKYVGWEQYSSVIKDVLGFALNSNVAESFNRTSLRYISQYKNFPLLDHIKGSINIENNLGLNKQELKLSSVDASRKVYVTLSNNIERKDNSGNKYLASLFDVNIFDNVQKTSDLSIIILSLEEIHQKEKEIFFGLIDDELLKILKPEY